MRYFKAFLLFCAQRLPLCRLASVAVGFALAVLALAVGAGVLGEYFAADRGHLNALLAFRVAELFTYLFLAALVVIVMIAALGRIRRNAELDE